MNIPGINTSPEVVAQQVERLRLLYGRAYFVADMLEAIVAELIAARTKLAAAERLADAVRLTAEDPYRFGARVQAMKLRSAKALAEWEAAE